MAGLGAPEMLIVLAVLLLLFGGAQVPKLARSIGEAHREFRKHADDRGEGAVRRPADGGSRSSP